jgi:hypothetical protein
VLSEIKMCGFRINRKLGWAIFRPTDLKGVE